MPNYCHNNLHFSGDCDIINEIKNDIFNDELKLTFAKLLPTPSDLCKNYDKSLEESNEFKEKYGFDNWYDWRIHNWGTKWDAIDSVVNQDENNIRIFFDTAWCPPMNWIFYINKKYPNLNLSIKFIDEMGGLIGLYQFENGQVIIEEYFNDYDYSTDGDLDEALTTRINSILRRKKIEKIIKNIN